MTDPDSRKSFGKRNRTGAWRRVSPHLIEQPCLSCVTQKKGTRFRPRFDLGSGENLGGPCARPLAIILFPISLYARYKRAERAISHASFPTLLPNDERGRGNRPGFSGRFASTRPGANKSPELRFHDGLSVRKELMKSPHRRSLLGRSLWPVRRSVSRRFSPLDAPSGSVSSFSVSTSTTKRPGSSRGSSWTRRPAPSSASSRPPLLSTRLFCSADPSAGRFTSRSTRPAGESTAFNSSASRWSSTVSFPPGTASSARPSTAVASSAYEVVCSAFFGASLKCRSLCRTPGSFSRGWRTGRVGRGISDAST